MKFLRRLQYWIDSRRHEAELETRRDDLDDGESRTAVVISATALGLVLALVASRVLRGMLLDVSPTDPVTIGVIASILGLAALAACYLPARRAARVDAVIALRNE